jgi:hypothetical protein
MPDDTAAQQWVGRAEALDAVEVKLQVVLPLLGAWWSPSILRVNRLIPLSTGGDGDGDERDLTKTGGRSGDHARCRIGSRG